VSPSKVVDPVVLQAWASTPVLTPLAAPITLEGGKFCSDKQHDKAPLIPGHCVSNPAIDQTVKILKKFWCDYEEDSEDLLTDCATSEGDVAGKYDGINCKCTIYRCSNKKSFVPTWSCSIQLTSRE
jgi:hypothetical protein